MSGLRRIWILGLLVAVVSSCGNVAFLAAFCDPRGGPCDTGGPVLVFGGALLAFVSIVAATTVGAFLARQRSVWVRLGHWLAATVVAVLVAVAVWDGLMWLLGVLME